MLRKTAIQVLTPVLLLCGLVSGCGAGANGGAAPSGSAVVQGQVSGSDPLVGATVAFVPAADVAASASIQPVEDLAATTSYKAVTNNFGEYSIALPAGRYYVYTTPPASDTLHLPGGDVSAKSLDLAGGSTTVADITLSQQPSGAATWVGQGTCATCHSGTLATGIASKIKKTGHMRSLRRPGMDSALWDNSVLTTTTPLFSGGIHADDDGNSFNDFEQSQTVAFAGPPHKRYNGREITVKRKPGFPADSTEYSLTITLGYKDIDDSNTLTNGDVLCATWSVAGVPTTFDIWFVKGGGRFGWSGTEANGMLRMVTKVNNKNAVPRQAIAVAFDTVGANQLPATTPGWHQHVPFRYNENAAVAKRWVADGTMTSDWVDTTVAPTTTKWPTGKKNYDNRCIGCHSAVTNISGTQTTGFLANVHHDTSGQVDWDLDLTTDNPSFTCERCHGPGSEHAAEAKGKIVHPAKLGPAARTMVCGQCHSRQEGVGAVDGQTTYFPSKVVSAVLTQPRVGGNPTGPEATRGLIPSTYYGTTDGTGAGILPYFGTTTTTGFSNPKNLATDNHYWWKDKATWPDLTKTTHSVWMHHEYMDFSQNRMFKNAIQMVACFDCHNEHEHPSTTKKQLKRNADNNALCLMCHNKDFASLGGFTNVTRGIADNLHNATASLSEIDIISTDVMKHIADKTFTLVGASMNLAPGTYNPLGSLPVGRCITCHMAKTVKKNLYVTDADGFYIEGDTHSHTFDIVRPQLSQAMANSNHYIDMVQNPVIPNSCVPCHRGTGYVVFPDFRYKK